MNLTEASLNYLKLSTDSIPVVFLSPVKILNLQLTFIHITVQNRNRREKRCFKKSEDERPHTNCRERTEHDTPVPGKLCLQWDR